jgi:hypothetical protein
LIKLDAEFECLTETRVVEKDQFYNFYFGRCLSIVANFGDKRAAMCRFRNIQNELDASSKIQSNFWL